jgi:lysine N6-hydroxylase
MTHPRAASADGRAVPHVHTAGIGAGPANLSLAALFRAVAPHEIVLFERQPGPGWHDPLLHEGVRMQTGWLKDLVSTVDPTNPLSFLNYLVKSGRLFTFLNAQFTSVPRLEYVRYLAWAAEQLGVVRYGTSVDGVTFADGRFELRGGGGDLLATADHLVFSLGTVARVPDCFRDVTEEHAVVPERLADRAPAFHGRADQPVAVIGNGQTGAEAVLALLDRGFQNVLWLGSRPWFMPLDESPSANEFYRPAYSDFLHGLIHEQRQRAVASHRLTSDGISAGTLTTVYQRNYDALLTHGHAPVHLLPGRFVVAARAEGDRLHLTCVSDGRSQTVTARWAVLATGREPAPLPIAGELLEQLERTDGGDLVVDDDYSVPWKHGDQNRIFVFNRGTNWHGRADANLSLLPVRSAIALNALFGRDVYPMRDSHNPTEWL